MKGILQVALTSESKALLTSFSVFDVVKCDHITVQFGIKDDSELMQTVALGSSVSINVNSIGRNDRIQAAQCDAPEISALFPEGKIVHITISHIEGAKPVESNTMLINPDISEKITGVILTGTLEFKPF